MTSRQIERWARMYLLPALPGFRARGNAAFVAPVGLVHKVVVCDRSRGDPTTFSHIYLAAMPLWTPFTATNLSYSIDLLHPGRDAQGPVRADNAANVFAKIARLVRSRSPEVFDRIGTPELFLRNCRRFLIEQAEAHDYEASLKDFDRLPITQDLAGAALLAGDASEAIRFGELFIGTYVNDASPHFRNRVDEMREFVRLAMVDPPGAKRLLREWDRYTVGQLKLGDHLEPGRWGEAD